MYIFPMLKYRLVRWVWYILTLPLFIFFVVMIPLTVRHFYTIFGMVVWTLWGFLLWSLMKYGFDIPYPTLFPASWWSFEIFNYTLYPAQMVFILCALITFGMVHLNCGHLTVFCLYIVVLQLMKFEEAASFHKDFYGVNSVHNLWFQVIYLGYTISCFANDTLTALSDEKPAYVPFYNPWKILKKEQQEVIPVKEEQPTGNPVTVGTYQHGVSLMRQNMQEGLPEHLQALLKK